ncbi:H-NS histone family protein [Acinetobacter baumannii]|nr:H-NS histone family protein [Acinetobacter baumannii]EKX8645064.1 H-NS histone family protein [Acinetobacter baumannii]ELB2329718.1 H-NS histone family protein [Acinetobacter baumannii]
MSQISELSIEELKDLQLEAAKLIEIKKEQAIEDAYLKIISIAESVGYSVEDLLKVGAANSKKKAHKSVKPRYRSKANEQDTWTGRGKQPRWLVAEIEKGAKLEDLRIN